MSARRKPTTQWDQALARVMASSRHYKTQTALARKSGVAQSTIGRVLRGEVNPQTSTMTFLAEALGIPLKTLAAGAEGEPQEVERVQPQSLTCNDDNCKHAKQELQILRLRVNDAIKQLDSLVQGDLHGGKP
jgi:transcriptional regulator with XRE-family HTH domain